MSLDIDIYPQQACYHPGERVRLQAELTTQTAEHIYLVVTIHALCEEVARLEHVLEKGAQETLATEFCWSPPAAAPRGYGVELRATNGAGELLATASTAFDVLDDWTQAPRYGFLSDFRPERDDVEATLAWLTRYHVNGLQFYDWMYRHEQLLPPAETFADPLGRPLSMCTVRRLIAAAHARGIAALPYTAIYGASPTFQTVHPEWTLFDAEHHPILFAGDFLRIMNPAAEAPWRAHLLREFEQVLEQTAFDGIHIDQYGDPKEGYDAQGRRVDLALVFPDFIHATKEVVQRHRGERGAVIFNAVGNWPIETVAPADQDVVYIEVWPPHTTYEDLHRLIVAGQRLSGGKPVVLAAYLDPAWAANVRLTDAVIFASGGFHIELGERRGMLADPYFPKYGQLSDELARVLRRYYDFAVRYENVLSQGTRDGTASWAERVILEQQGQPLTGTGRLTDGVRVLAREGDGQVALSLINLPDAAHREWLTPLAKAPVPLQDLRVRCYVDQPIARVWWASPDGESQQAQVLDFDRGQDDRGTYVTFTLPSLIYWDMIGLEATDG